MTGLLRILVATLLLQNATPSPAPTPRPASIEGTVVGPSGEPLAKATLVMTGPTEPSMSIALRTDFQVAASSGAFQSSATTGTDGKFTIENLRPGSYLLEAQRTGFLSTDYGQKGPNGLGVPLVLAPGQKRKDLELVMTPQGAITGHVVDRNGEPLSRAVVQALKYVYQEQGRILTVVQAVTTNDMGDYRLYWLAPGAYVVSATSNDNPALGNRPISPLSGLPLSGDAYLAVLRATINTGNMSGGAVNSRTLNDGSVVEESPVPVFYPGTSSPHEAMPVVVRGGATTGGINITASPSRVQHIRGRTLNGTTGQPEAMYITLVLRDGPNVQNSSGFRSNDNGAFDLAGVVPGSYFLVATMSEVRGVVPVDVGGADVNNVTVTATEGFTINGTITTEGTTAGGTPPVNPTQIRLVSATPAIPSNSAVMTNGAFSFQGVLPGDYQLTILGNADRYLKSVRLGSEDGLNNVLHILRQPDADLEIIVSMSTARLEGHIFNDRREPVSNATIVVIPDPPLRQRTSLYYTPRADSSGKFQVQLAPGHYKVFAWEDVEPRAWFDADFIRTYENSGRPVTLNDNGLESVDVTTIPYTSTP